DIKKLYRQAAGGPRPIRLERALRIGESHDGIERASPLAKDAMLEVRGDIGGDSEGCTDAAGGFGVLAAPQVSADRLHLSLGQLDHSLEDFEVVELRIFSIKFRHNISGWLRFQRHSQKINPPASCFDL